MRAVCLSFLLFMDNMVRALYDLTGHQEGWHTLMNRLIVFTDLDGTLLDYHTYAFDAAVEGIGLLHASGVPLVFCTSKSYAEVLHFRETTGNASPFIVENGGAVYIPEDHFKDHSGKTPFDRLPRHDGFAVVEIGADYGRVRAAFGHMRAALGGGLTGFGDMSAERVAAYLNMPIELARMAKVRRHDEPFLLDDPALLVEVERLAGRHGLKVFAGTRFYHLMGDTDKGAAVKALVSIYNKVYEDITTAAVGEGRNDEPMFRAVDVPYLVQRPDGGYVDIAVPGIVKIDGIGPAGFTLAVKALLKSRTITK